MGELTDSLNFELTLSGGSATKLLNSLSDFPGEDQFAGDIDENLVKIAREKKLTASEFLSKLTNADGQSVVQKWEKLIRLPKEYQGTLEKMKTGDFADKMKTLKGVLTSFDSPDRKDHALFTSDECFSRIKQMMSQGKINVMQGDLTGNSMESLGAILRRANEEVSAVDVSNVPGYFTSQKQTEKMSKMVSNLQKLPLAKGMNLLLTEETKYSSDAKKLTAKGQWLHYCLGKDKLKTLEQFKSVKAPLKAYQQYLDTAFHTPSGGPELLRVFDQ